MGCSDCRVDIISTQLILILLLSFFLPLQDKKSKQNHISTTTKILILNLTVFKFYARLINIFNEDK